MDVRDESASAGVPQAINGRDASGQSTVARQLSSKALRAPPPLPLSRTATQSTPRPPAPGAVQTSPNEGPPSKTELSGDIAEAENLLPETACSTLAALTAVFIHSRAVPRGAVCIMVAVTVLILCVQTMCAFKLYRNAGQHSDPDQLKIFVLDGYMRLNNASATAVCGTEPATINISSPGCKLAMGEAVGDIFDTLRASGRPTGLHDLSICLTADGLLNGAVNMAAGLFIVGLSVARELVEVGGARYATVGVSIFGRSFAWVWITGSATVFVNILLVTASLERTLGLANDFWSVVETAVAVFLVTQVDDLACFCALNHPKTATMLSTMRASEATGKYDPMLLNPAQLKGVTNEHGQKEPVYLWSGFCWAERELTFTEARKHMVSAILMRAGPLPIPLCTSLITLTKPPRIPPWL